MSARHVLNGLECGMRVVHLESKAGGHVVLVDVRDNRIGVATVGEYELQNFDPGYKRLYLPDRWRQDVASKWGNPVDASEMPPSEPW